MNRSSRVAFGVVVLGGLLTCLPGVAADGEKPVADTAVQSACEVGYPPFSVVADDGRATGFAVELMRAALSKMGREVTFRTGPWAEVRGWLERGEVEALPLVGRTSEREVLFDFTIPYLTLHGAIVVREDATNIRSLADLRGQRVAVMEGDNAEEFMRRADRGATLLTTPTFKDALEGLSAGTCDAVVIPHLVALRLMDKFDFGGLRIVRQPLLAFRQDFCFAVREGDRELLAVLNEGLALVVADGTRRQLHAKWFADMQLPHDRPIIVGGDHNYPPWEFLDEKGQPAGYNVDLIRAAADAVGIDVRIELGPWEEVVRRLARDEIDAVQGMFYSPQRDETFDFSQAHAVHNCVGVVRKGGGPPPTELEDLEGRSIVVQRGDIMHEVAVRHGLGDRVVAVDAQEDALRQLAAGKHDCALVARVTALHLIEKHGWDTFRVGKTSLVRRDYCFAVRDGNDALLSHLTEGLTLIEQTGRYREIHEKWLGVYGKDGLSAAQVTRYVALVTVPLLVILLLALLWLWTLRREVARRTAELRQSERRYRMIADNTVDCIWRMDMNFEFTYVNSAVTTIFGYAPEEFVGTRLPDHCDQDHFEQMRAIIEDKSSRPPAEASVVFETELLHKQDYPVSVEIHGTVSFDASGAPLGVQGVTRDITERHQAQQRMKQLNRVLRSIRDVNQLIVRETDAQSIIDESCGILAKNSAFDAAVILLDNFAAECLLSAQSGLDASLFDRFERQFRGGTVPECCARAREVPGSVAVTDSRTSCGDCPLAKAYPDRGVFATVLEHQEKRWGYLWIVIDKSFVHDDEEQALIAEIAGDIAFALHAQQINRERLRAEREAISLARFSAENPNPVLRVSADGVVTYANDGATEILSELLQTGVGGTVAEPWRRRIVGTLSSRRTENVEMSVHGRIFSATVTPVPEHGYVNVYARDTTEERRLAEQLQQAQKLESVGRLAGGVAHDFNNLLMGIMNYADMGCEEIENDHPVRPWFEEIGKAARRSASLTRQLLAFARRQEVAPEVLDLNGAVESMLKMLRRLIGEDVELEWRPAANPWLVWIDPGQVDQLLANLCVNARDAIGGVGEIFIETRNVAVDENYANAHAEAEVGDYVLLSVSDDGCGMDRETLEKVFEPFFTTKPIGEGTGLGLATVYGTVKQNEGFVHVYSEPDKGTTFRIYLPRVESEETARNPDGTPPEPEGGSETILLVEDEASIRATTAIFLEKLDYTVLVAENPEEALARVRDYADPIDLLITDVVMPGMNGCDLASKLAPDHPDMKVIYMSGYTADAIAHRGILEEDVNFLGKPFSREDIARKIREVLG